MLVRRIGHPAIRITRVRFASTRPPDQSGYAFRRGRQATPSSSQASNPPQQQQQAVPPSPPSPPSVSETLHNQSADENNLLAPVHIPEDPNAVLKERHPATSILAQSGLVVQRQLEMMNVFLGFEQANKYVIMDPRGNHVGYMAEHDGGIGKTMARQWFTTHRAFETHVFDKSQKEVLRVIHSIQLSISSNGS